MDFEFTLYNFCFVIFKYRDLQSYPMIPLAFFIIITESNNQNI